MSNDKKNRKKKCFFCFLFLIFILVLFFVFWGVKGDKGFLIAKENEAKEDNIEDAFVEIEKTDKEEVLLVESGQTFGALMSDYGFSNNLVNNLYQDSLGVYDLAKIRAGKELKFIYDKDTDEFKELRYKIDSEEELIVSRNNENWEAEIVPIEYEVKIVEKSGKLDSSLYQWALDNEVDERAIIEMANAFQWSIDFAMDPKKGDDFKFIYEERYLDGEYVMPGKLLAAKYVNSGEVYQLYYFKENNDNEGYFDENANSVQKMFLKAPVEFKYISSGFTTGQRYISEFGFSTTHRAVDYAATYGTPIRAVGDGTIVMARWNGSYGNMVSVRHNGTYTTNYAHMCKFAVSYGDKVKQGDVIGYVGSTGLSTGPHVHFEMVKNGIKINPLREVLPPGEAIDDENKDRFFNEISEYKEKLFN
ncbi:M23 family metallopeptidase [bacterium]|nr:M23 family metallopeptidase [bacterium]